MSGNYAVAKADTDIKIGAPLKLKWGDVAEYRPVAIPLTDCQGESPAALCPHSPDGLHYYVGRCTNKGEMFWRCSCGADRGLAARSA